MNESLIIKELGDGLVLRHAMPQDADALGEFNARIHSDDGPEQPDRHVEAWVRDLLERPHPTFVPRDFMLVENRASRQIVSCLCLISPTLERRLAESVFAGHSGELKITFYRSGLKMSFEQGELTGVQTSNPEPQSYSGGAGFPDLTFLQLLLCYRSLEELKYAFPDCWWEGDEAHGLLSALFPKQASAVWCLS